MHSKFVELSFEAETISFFMFWNLVSILITSLVNLVKHKYNPRNQPSRAETSHFRELTLNLFEFPKVSNIDLSMNRTGRFPEYMRNYLPRQVLRQAWNPRWAHRANTWLMAKLL